MSSGVRPYGAALLEMQRRYGGPVTERITEFNTDATAQRLVTFSGERVAIIFINAGTAECVVHFRQNLNSLRGFLIPAGGSVLAFNLREDAILPCLEWFAMQISVPTTLLVVEMLRITEVAT